MSTQAKAAVTHLVEHAVRCDPDGISLYFFSTTYDKHENMSSADDVMALFETHQPGGGTKLAKVRHACGTAQELCAFQMACF